MLQTLHSYFGPVSTAGQNSIGGDNHDIIVEKVEFIEGDPQGCARIVAGERACPPKDVGGPLGY